MGLCLLAKMTRMWMRVELHTNLTSAQTKYLRHLEMSPLECQVKQTSSGRHHLPLKRAIHSETHSKVIWIEILTRKASRPRGIWGTEARTTRQPAWYVVRLKFGSFFDGTSINSNHQPPGTPILAPHNPATVLVFHPLSPVALPRSLSHLQLNHKPLVH